MKKITLSVLALLAVESVVQADEYTPRDDYTMPAIYAGVAYTYTSGSKDFSISGFGSESIDISANQGVTINAGYDFNQYIGAEVRYSSSFNNATYELDGVEIYDNDKISNIGIYLKPQYKTQEGALYLLLGYGSTSIGDSDEDQFQWGIGFNVGLEDQFSLYFDYLRVYDDAETFSDGLDIVSTSTSINTYNFGLMYTF